MVMMKSVRKNGLYALDGVIASGSASIVEQIILSKTKI